MKPGEVAVTNLGEGGVYGSDSEITSDIFEDGSLMQTKVAFESQKRESIMKSLQNIPGVRVEVNADFNDTIEQTTRSIKPDKSGRHAESHDRIEAGIAANDDEIWRPAGTSRSRAESPGGERIGSAE